MNAKHGKTLAAIFAPSIPRSMACRDVESLLRALGCEKTEGEGSGVAYGRDGKSVVFHRPHPGKELKRYQIKEIRGFLGDIGVKP
jgi:predicted RNA binding protein YcfA (HicA-like mRNA interferase family)